ncbi:MAG TPA: MFS transporter [Actinomycetes bacterium]|nr:MFS transporter [Actinomycetes bacterium]
MLWLAQLGSLVGTWMQTVGAQWLLVDQPAASTLVALVQTANMSPVFFLALPAGVFADVFDRRRLLIAVQTGSLVVAAALAALTTAGEVTPALLLAFTFLLGCGQTLTMPAWQALIPELVPRSQLPAASALGGISMNLARAVGPAVAGLLIASVDVAAVFALNALSFGFLVVALATWRRRPVEPDDLPERFGSALVAGGRYIRHSRVVRRILLRSLLYVVPGTVVWALLALVASRRLGLGPGGYGLLLAALGVGAVAGAFTLPRLRVRTSTHGIVLLASLVYAAALMVVALVTNPAAVTVVLFAAGAAWLAVMASLNATMQLFLPGWVRARGLSTSQVVFVGGQGLAALGWGLLADQVGLQAVFLAAAGLMLAGAASLRWWPLHDTEGLDRSPAMYWPEPRLDFEPEPDDGPVLVTVTYQVPEERVPRFLEAMDLVRRSRQRTGASRWDLYRDGADRRQFVETFVVPSWAEHLRQHGERLTGTDQAIEERAIALADGTPQVQHLFSVPPRS